MSRRGFSFLNGGLLTNNFVRSVTKKKRVNASKEN
jgi:hypothetical protein